MVTVVLVDYDPAWVDQFELLAGRISAALGFAAERIEHVGSTSIPGLAAKPIIDIVLTVPDSNDEAAYVPALEEAGFAFCLREPEWFEHRLLKGTEPAANLHVFSDDCSEVDAMIAFRDHLRSHDDDRALYEQSKRELAQRQWDSVQDYADAKTEVVQDIQSRIVAA
jgi:GrpB-like predicted nucleotidyltransferase (UPF0157 family)